MRFDFIYVDPPWNWRSWTPAGSSRSPKYSKMDLAAIKTLDIGSIASENAMLAMWITDPFLIHGPEILRAWGFEYSTVLFYWVKLNKDGTPFMGTGYSTRANPEQCWLARRKGGRFPRVADRSVQRVILSERPRIHSRKPDEAYHRIDRLWPNLSKVELFATQPWPGYVSMGYSIDGSDIIKSIEKWRHT